ncbi:DUF4424 family protein [Rhizomicrobium electricum]|uniref:DUF4424 domain-containing protein n=1 Tax=Rhizomicrobium electricum TaxID=480070 RepID=A0ABN1EII7_9PROT|nr:DUF4424 family protein [Rhizomicrobium electricum]NIJ48367.1 hypothetical protein [Rhizomicrobium electricum]
MRIAGWVAALAVMGAANADDSSAMLKAGSIVFTKNTPVRMAAEDLYVSPTAVRIRFEFENPTGRDVETLVAFPLPDISTWDFAESPIGTITDDAKNFIGFKAVVDGKPVAVTVEQRAFLKTKDVTAQLLAAGAVLNPVADGGYEKLAKLPKEKKKALIAAGLAEGDGADEFYPQWTVKTKFYWTQKFPAKKKVVIEHSYQPVTGQSFFTTAYHKRGDKALFGNLDYCIDDRTWATLAARTGGSGEPSDGTRLMTTYETSYILSTAGNWQGPIGKFHLTLDKLKSDNVLSLCWDGDLKKTGATTFEFSRDNFAPKRDIVMAVFENAGPQ